MSPTSLAITDRAISCKKNLKNLLIWFFVLVREPYKLYEEKDGLYLTLKREFRMTQVSLIWFWFWIYGDVSFSIQKNRVAWGKDLIFKKEFELFWLIKTEIPKFWHEFFIFCSQRIKMIVESWISWWAWWWQH